jgi:hypothetical protein
MSLTCSLHEGRPDLPSLHLSVVVGLQIIFSKEQKATVLKKKLHLKEKHVYNNISKTDEKGHRRSIRKK